MILWYGWDTSDPRVRQAIRQWHEAWAQMLNRTLPPPPEPPPAPLTPKEQRELTLMAWIIRRRLPDDDPEAAQVMPVYSAAECAPAADQPSC